MRKILIAALVSLTACGGSTEPATPWWQGTWNLVSMDGRPLPAELTNSVGLVYRYESMRVTLSSFTGFGYRYSYAHPVNGIRSTLACSAFVESSKSGDVVTLRWSTSTNDTCPYGNVDGRTFTRDGANMAATWNGHRAVLSRE